MTTLRSEELTDGLYERHNGILREMKLRGKLGDGDARLLPDHLKNRSLRALHVGRSLA